MTISWPTVMWYRFLIALAGRLRHFRAGAYLHDHHRAVGLHYHCLGGDLNRNVAADAGTGGVSGTHGGVDPLAWLDRDQMHLPGRINRYPTRALNRELYFWLAAFFALDRALEGEQDLPAGLRHLFRGIATSTRVLDKFPALASRYRRLCTVELAQRRDALPSLGEEALNPVHQLEAGIRYSLGASKPPADPWLRTAIGEARGGTCPTLPQHWGRISVPVFPVPLWGRPSGEATGLRLRWLKRRMRRRAQGFSKPLARPRFDPGLPALSTTGAAAHGENLYPEWDHRRCAYKANWCHVTEEAPRPTGYAPPDRGFAALARRVRRQFETIREIRRWARGLESGDEVDLDAFVDSAADRRSCGMRSTRLYRRRESAMRDLSAAILLDVSRSTAAWVGEQRVVEVARQAMEVLAEALSAAGDEFAQYGFSSDSRLRVRCHRLKGFDEEFEDRVRRRLYSLDPRDYTRMGAAIRHVGGQLEKRAHAQKLMLVITDGRPHDPIDGYEGRYALEDTRRALKEIRAHGVHCFGLTIDQRGRGWLPYLFGPGHYAVFSRLDALPPTLPRLYARITGLGG